MSNNISVTQLTGNQFLVEKGKKQYLLHAPEYADWVNYCHEVKEQVQYDMAVKDFFQPLLDATEQPISPVQEAAQFVVRQAQSCQEEAAFTFSGDSLVLRLIELKQEEYLLFLKDRIVVKLRSI